MYTNVASHMLPINPIQRLMGSIQSAIYEIGPYVTKKQIAIAERVVVHLNTKHGVEYSIANRYSNKHIGIFTILSKEFAGATKTTKSCVVIESIVISLFIMEPT